MSTFSLDIQRFVQKTKINLSLVFKKLAIDGYTQIVILSPVDTGRFRANWRIALGSADTSPDSDAELGAVYGSPPSGDQMQRAQSVVGQIDDKVSWGEEVRVVISNNLLYAEPLENGHSKQAPAGMLHVTFEKLKADLEHVVNSLK